MASLARASGYQVRFLQHRLPADSLALQCYQRSTTTVWTLTRISFARIFVTFFAIQ